MHLHYKVSGLPPMVGAGPPTLPGPLGQAPGSQPPSSILSPGQNLTGTPTGNTPLQPSNTPLQPSSLAGVGKWILGMGGTWIVLTIAVDLGDTAEVAVAFSVVLMGTVLLTYGPTALRNLGFLP